MRKLALGAAGTALAAAAWWRKNPSACPYGQRFVVQIPHPLVTRDRLREILEPRPGERVLELGPGTGYYSLDAARWLEPGGTLEVFDLQQEMLDHTMRKASEAGLSNLVPTQGDATQLSYDDASFDGAFLVTVLGEIPDQEAALRELRRVLKPGGRVVFGEIAFDPHLVPLGKLRERAERSGLSYERRVGTALGFFARFSAP